jgi:hypothetical protein
MYDELYIKLSDHCTVTRFRAVRGFSVRILIYMFAIRFRFAISKGKSMKTRLKAAAMVMASLGLAAGVWAQKLADKKALTLAAAKQIARHRELRRPRTSSPW